jgi:magnesium transporter
VGSAPGTLVPPPAASATHLVAIGYGKGAAELQKPATVAEVAAMRQRHPRLWLDVAGLADTGLIAAIGELFSLHRLALADAVNVQQRAKVEDYATHDFLVLRMVNPAPLHDTEQLAICLGADFVVTFQERPGDCFDPVRTRLQDPNGKLATSGPDALAYALLDAAVDAFFPGMEAIGDKLEAIESRVLDFGDPRALLGELHALRRSMLELRRALWPLREATSALLRGECKQFRAEVRPYLRDVHDHVVQQLDLLENYREMGTSLMELQLSTTSNRLNEVMKVLTIIATIFIPLTFVAGVYGMNFRHMPEIEWYWGYPACLLLMAAMAGGMLWWFRRRRWL